MTHEVWTVDDWHRERGTVPHKAQVSKGIKDITLPSRSHGGRGSDGRTMTKAEKQMCFELDLQFRAGQIKHWSFQAVKVRLADRTWYTPDVFIQWQDGRFEFREVKGHWEDDARIKFKVAAELHPWATFTAWRLVKGAWQTEVASASSRIEPLTQERS